MGTNKTEDITACATWTRNSALGVIITNETAQYMKHEQNEMPDILRQNQSSTLLLLHYIIIEGIKNEFLSPHIYDHF